MIPYIVTFTNGAETIVYARDGRHAWQVASMAAARSFRQVASIR